MVANKKIALAIMLFAAVMSEAVCQQVAEDNASDVAGQCKTVYCIVCVKVNFKGSTMNVRTQNIKKKAMLLKL